MFITRTREGENALKAINRSFYISAGISLVLTIVAAFVYLPSSFTELPGVNQAAVGDLVAAGNPALIAAIAVAIGIVLAIIILALTGYYTGTEDQPVKDVGTSSLTGAATVILAGISVGFESAVYTAIVIGPPSTARSCCPARSSSRCSRSPWPAPAC